MLNTLQAAWSKGCALIPRSLAGGAVVGVLAAGLWLTGCAAGGGSRRAAPYRSLAVTLDGDIAEWPGDAAVTADERYLYLRFTVEGEQFTLQSAPQSVVLYLDVDASPATGFVPVDGPMKNYGLDLRVRFSPAGANGKPSNGVVLERMNPDGSATALPVADFELQVAPTYASSWYELRLTRTPADLGGLPEKGLFSSAAIAPVGPHEPLGRLSRLQGLAGVLSATGELDAWADPFAIDRLGPAGVNREPRGGLPPEKPVGAFRVMTYNVERGHPMESPATFGRIFTALKPDVIFVQEWDAGETDDLAGWFRAYATSSEEWHVVKPPGPSSKGGGVAVISRWKLEEAMPPVMIGDRATRFAAAWVDAPGGAVLLGSGHLKCCGTKGSSEDQRRMAEAKAINASLARALEGRPGSGVVIGGDMNLVGTRPPLDLLRAGLDADGSDLDVADAPVLGDAQYATWRDTGTPFTPGRLDYLMYSDSRLKAVHAFVFDTGRLSDETLARLGLDRTDAMGSDHLPVVLDLAP